MTPRLSSVPSAIVQLAGQSEVWHELLVAWCDLNSGSNNFDGLARMALVLQDAFGPLADHCELVPVGDGRRRAVIARRRPAAARQILLSGHYDTVYGSDHPFQQCAQLDAVTLRGPGVADMKGGLVALLAALKAFEATPSSANVGWEVVIGPDEEIGSGGTRPLLEAAARRCQVGLVFEPARENGDIVGSRKAVGRFRISSHGQAAHVANAREEGRNAIVALTDFLVAIRALPAERSGVLVNLGRIEGGGATNVVPDHAEAVLDVRVDRKADTTWVSERLESIAESIRGLTGCRLVVAGDFPRPPMEASPVTDHLFTAWQHAAHELGLAPFSKIHSGGGSDANLIAAAGTPCLDGLGPVGGRLHSVDEFVHLPSLLERAQLTALCLHHFATGKIGVR